VRQSIRDLLQRLPHAAAIVLSATYEVIAWNHLGICVRPPRAIPTIPR
jgi:hypothetical protein